MKARRPSPFFIIVIAVIGVLGVAGWGLLRTAPVDDNDAATAGITAGATPTPSRPGISFPARGHPAPDAADHAASRARLMARFSDDAVPTAGPGEEDFQDLLTPAISWNRKQLISALEEMMAADLSPPTRAYLFAELLNLLSAKDGAKALALYDHAWENANFNREGGGFYIYQLVLNLAKYDPAGATRWLEDRRDRVPAHITRILLERIDRGPSR